MRFKNFKLSNDDGEVTTISYQPGHRLMEITSVDSRKHEVTTMTFTLWQLVQALGISKAALMEALDPNPVKRRPAR